MSKDSPKVHVNRKAVTKGLPKRKLTPKHSSFTTRFETTLLNEFRQTAENEGFSATQLLEALMKSYLGK